MKTELCEMTNNWFRGVEHMTIELLKDRLEVFKSGLQEYRDLRNEQLRSSSKTPGNPELVGLVAHNDKLRQQFDYLDEAVTKLSRGRYRIHVGSDGCHDMYTGIFLEDSPLWYLDAVLEDLEGILEELKADLPCDQKESVSLQKSSLDVSRPAVAFGALGHQGHSQVPNSHELRPAYTPLIRPK
jgi:hypothetical protein